MLNRNLPDDAVSLLLEAISYNPPLESIVAKLGHIPLTPEEREQLREAVADEICRSGLNEQGGPNRRGAALDQLIDILAHL